MSTLHHRRLLTVQLLLSSTIGPSGTLSILKSHPEAESLKEIDPLHPALRRWRDPLQLLHRQSNQLAQQAANSLQSWSQKGIETLLPQEAAFPSLLRESPYCPAILFFSGTMGSERERPLAVVGTRRCTRYGERACRTLLEELTPYSPAILSGLARGIDRIAHQEALRLKLKTVAVLGQGHLSPLDYEGRLLAEQITEQGAVISPFFPEMRGKEWTFPYRNRILSGMAQGTLVVESSLKGGALITARLALDEGRDVLAVPGPIDSEQSKGCNRLIAEGAQLALDGGAIAELLRWKPGLGPLFCQPEQQLTPEEELLYNHCPRDATSVDALLRQLPLEVSTALAILATLEMKGMVRLLPGNRIERER